MVTLTPQDLPEQIRRLHEPPKCLYTSGRELSELMGMPKIGVVGARKVTPYGRAVTSQLSSDLARTGIVIVSGLALGVDSVAHKATLEAGGKTIAVLPTGLNKIYPTSHYNLAKEITAKGGAIVTEYPPDTDPLQFRFIARNRIIAALSEGLLITEAAINSGSLHTARFALELGITVFAVPGPINNPMSEGTNNLIKAGAVPVTSVQDILDTMNWQASEIQTEELMAASQEELTVLKLIKAGVTDGHELLSKSQLEVAKFNQTLTMLEITGRIRPLGANHWALA